MMILIFAACAVTGMSMAVSLALYLLATRTEKRHNKE